MIISRDLFSFDFYIEKSDPVVMMTEEMFNAIMNGGAVPGVVLKGKLLYFKGINKEAIYKIVDYDFERALYLLIWPD